MHIDLDDNYLKKKHRPQYPYLKMTVRTWSKDIFNVFDYEAQSDQYIEEVMNIYSSSNMYRNIVTMINKHYELQYPYEVPPEEIYIATLVIDEQNQCKVQPDKVTGIQPQPELKKWSPNLFDNCYVSLRDFQMGRKNAFPLKAGQTIKFAKVEFMVLEIHNGDSLSTFKQISHLQLNNTTISIEKPQTGSCYVCLESQSTKENPLSRLCYCKSEDQFIHIDCLKQWIHKKIRKGTNQLAVTFNFSKFECELCKAPFPKKVVLPNGQDCELITISKPKKQYILMESMNKKEEKMERTLHLLSPQEGEKIKIGRGDECEVELSDLSISRVHSKISFEEGQFYLEDNDSKYGTLVKFEEEIMLEQNLTLQSNRTAYNFEVVRRGMVEKEVDD